MNRFISEYRDYLAAVVQEVKDRKAGYIRTIEEHILLRRGTAAGGPLFLFTCLPDDIPDEIADHPEVKELTILAMDIVGLANVGQLEVSSLPLISNFAGSAVFQPRTIYWSNTQCRHFRSARKKPWSTRCH